MLVAAIIVWNRRGRPLPSRPDVAARSVFRDPILALLAAVVIAALGYQAFLALLTPPNNWDSLAYHLARAAEWYQRGAVDYFPTHSENLNAPQPNAEMLTLHGFVFADRDTFAAIPQLLAELACIVAIYGNGVRLGFSRSASLYAALIAATLPQVVLQSVTTQNDLLTASFLASALYFTLGLRMELPLAGLALGLALGTKATAGFAIPLLLLAAFMTHGRRDVVRGAAFALAGFVLVGAYGYVLNVVHTGRPLGAPRALGELLQPSPSFPGTVSTAARLSYEFLDVSGYPIPGSCATADRTRREAALRHRGYPGESARIDGARAGTHRVAVRLQHQHESGRDSIVLRSAWCSGLVPLSCVFLVGVALRRASPRLLVPALAIPLFIVGVAVSTRYNGFNGRYFLPAVILAMPLVATVYRRRGLAAAVAGVGALTLVLVHVSNENKPSGGRDQPAIWTRTRTEAQSAREGAMNPVLAGVERLVAPNARLGYVLRHNDWIYPYYGTRLDRRLVKLPRDGLFAAADRDAVDAIVVAPGRSNEPPGHWRPIDFPASGWTLFLRRAAFEPP